MIDIHTHTLFGVDDGAKTIEESKQMIKSAAENGIKHLFLTPHVAPKRKFIEKKEIYDEKFKELSDLSKDYDVKLYLGSEIDEDDQLYHLLNNNDYTMLGSNTVLIDFGMRQSDIEEICYTLRIKGFQVIIAHPERYHHYSFDEFVKAKAQGALLQVSAPHLVKKGSRKSQKIAHLLLKRDMIDFVASDAHAPEHFVFMKEAYKEVVKKKGEEVANQLFMNNAQAIFNIND